MISFRARARALCTASTYEEAEMPETNDNHPLDLSPSCPQRRPSKDDWFVYEKNGHSVSGPIGQVCSHDGESVQVVLDCAGHEICAIRDSDLRIIRGDTVTVPNHGAIFVFAPSPSL